MQIILQAVLNGPKCSLLKMQIPPNCTMCILIKYEADQTITKNRHTALFAAGEPNTQRYGLGSH